MVDDLALGGLAGFQTKIGRERIPIGFEHNIDEGSVEFARTSEPRATAGTARVSAEDDGIYLRDISWNDMGRQFLSHYEDLSPTPVFDKDSRRVLGLLSVSLTRTGSIHGLTVENAATATLSASLARRADIPGGGQSPGVGARGLFGMARVIAANEAAMAKDPHEIARLSARRREIAGPPPKGFDRIVAANDRDNAERQQRLARLSAAPSLHHLHGKARVIAANERDNAANQKPNL